MELKYMKCFWWRYSFFSIGGIRSLNHLVLGDHVLQLGRRQSTWLSCIGDCLRGMNVRSEEALADKFY